MKRLIIIALLFLFASCSQKQKITQCPSHINDSFQKSSIQVMKDMHVNGVVLVIDSASNLVVCDGVKDSIEMTEAEVYSWLSMMLNPGNIFKPMLMTTILENDTISHRCLEQEYQCGRFCMEGVEIADNGGFVSCGKMDIKSALNTGSNAAFCSFINEIYPNADSRVILSYYTTSKMLPRGIPFTINGLISQVPRDFLKYCIGYGSTLQPYTIAFFYNALLNHGSFRLIDEDCSYRFETICSKQTAGTVVELLGEQETGRVGIHGTMMDSTSSYPSYVGFSSDMKYTVLIMLDDASNTAIAMRVFDRVVDILKN